MDEELNYCISVILPVYNGEEYLEYAVSSILNQSFTNFEFIIINDGSTDKSSEILNNYANTDNRIRLIERENRGLVYSLNEGIKLSRGKFIARMDSDDFSYSTRFQEQVELLEREGADICGCHYNVVSNNNKKLVSILCPLSDESIVLCLSASTVPFAHGSVMIRKAFLEENDLKYKSTSLAEDYNLWVDFYARKAKFVNVDEFLFDYRVHINSITGKIQAPLRKAGKDISINFLKQNLNRSRNAINILLSTELTESEEILLIITAYRLFKISKDIIIWYAIKKVSSKSKIFSFFKIISGKV